MIKEHERIVLKAPVPSEGLEAGDVGTVVHLYRDGLAYEVEFTTPDGKTAAVVTLEARQVRREKAQKVRIKPESDRSTTNRRTCRIRKSSTAPNSRTAHE